MPVNLLACVAGGILSRVKQWRRSRQFSRRSREKRAAKPRDSHSPRDFAARIHSPLSKFYLTRTIPPATQAINLPAHVSLKSMLDRLSAFVFFLALSFLSFSFRTFARKSSNIDNFIKLLILIANELLVSEMQN